MTDDKLVKLIRSAVKDEVKPLHGEMARVTRDVRDLKTSSIEISLRFDRATRETSKELARIDSNIETLTEKVDGLTEKVEELNDKLDASFVDIHRLQEQTGAIWTKLDVIDEKTDRKIKEIREDLSLQTA